MICADSGFRGSRFASKRCGRAGGTSPGREARRDLMSFDTALDALCLLYFIATLNCAALSFNDSDPMLVEVLPCMPVAM